MLLQTNIKPRANGMVLYTAPSGITYEFKPDPFGYFVAEVKAEDVGHALATNHFEPVNEEDFEKAEELLAVEEADFVVGAEVDEPIDDVNVNALPIEGVKEDGLRKETREKTKPKTKKVKG